MSDTGSQTLRGKHSRLFLVGCGVLSIGLSAQVRARGMMKPGRKIRTCIAAALAWPCKAERSLEEEEPPSSARFLLMTFGMWLVYTLIYEYVRRLCRRYWVVELSEPRAKGQRESQTDVLAQEHGAASASAQSTVTHADRGVKANDLPAQICFSAGGDKYHTSRSCPGLNAVDEKQVRTRNLCKHCEKKGA